MTDRIDPRAIEASGYGGGGTQALHDDGTWKVPGGGVVTTVRESLVAASGDQLLTLGATPVPDSPYVWVDGALLWPGAGYSIADAVIQFDSPLAASDAVWLSYKTTEASPGTSTLDPIASPAYSTEVLTDSPWGFWEQAETSGSTLADASGNSRTLTITGAPTLAQIGPDGSSADAISWPSSASTEHYAASAVTVSTTTCTLETWVKVSANPTALTPLVATAASYGSGTQRIAFYLRTDGKLGWMTYRGGANATHLTSSAALTLGTWHHVVASIGAAGAKIRVDKSTVASDAGTAISAGAELLFLHGGGSSDASSAFTNGSAVSTARPAFYTAQLSDARTDAHYDAA